MKELEKEQPIYLNNISCYLNFSFFFRFSIKEPQQLKPKAHLPSLSNGQFLSFLQYYISISSSIKSVDKLSIYLDLMLFCPFESWFVMIFCPSSLYLWWLRLCIFVVFSSLCFISLDLSLYALDMEKKLGATIWVRICFSSIWSDAN